MDAEKIRQYCISKKATTEGFPFDETTLVLKVANKMFALMNLSGDLRLNIKCTPENVIDYIENYDSVLPGYHMNKKHWVTIMIDGTIDDKTILTWIDDSYNLIISALSKKHREIYDL